MQEDDDEVKRDASGVASEDVSAKPPSFSELVNLDNWDPLDDFLTKADSILFEDVKEGIELRKQLRKELIESLDFKDRIKGVPAGQIDWATGELFAGKVCGVDGTISLVPSITGGRVRIGVVATSYSGKTINRVLFVSQRRLAGKFASAIETIQKLKTVNDHSALFMRAVMAYAERDLALRQPQEWKMVHGELIPYELRTGLGQRRALKQCLDLGQRLIEAKTVIGVIEESHDIDLLNAAETLNKMEYLEARGLERDLMRYLKGTIDSETGERVRGAHFNQDDEKIFEEFVNEYASNIMIGVFKAGLKPYIFQAHKEVFDKAAAIVMADSAFQNIRGFPLLIDYADQVCATHLSAKEFERQVHFKTSQFGLEALGFEVGPRVTRRR
jgi:hypothetical protein